MRAVEFLKESKSHPVICVDVQPEYANYGRNSIICERIVNFVCNQTGPVLMFVNAEQDGLTNDSISSIKAYWEETADTYDEDYNSKIDWARFTIVDKGFGFFRSYMDQGVQESTIIKMIRFLYSTRKQDARDLTDEEFIQIMGNDDLRDEAFFINWTSISQLRNFSGAYIVGGGKNECLREVQLLMNAFNIRYREVSNLIY